LSHILPNDVTDRGVPKTLHDVSHSLPRKLPAPASKTRVQKSSCMRSALLQLHTAVNTMTPLRKTCMCTHQPNLQSSKTATQRFKPATQADCTHSISDMADSAIQPLSTHIHTPACTSNLYTTMHQLHGKKILASALRSSCKLLVAITTDSTTHKTSATVAKSAHITTVIIITMLPIKPQHQCQQAHASMRQKEEGAHITCQPATANAYSFRLSKNMATVRQHIQLKCST
jgi:hypothetical protein